MTDTPNPPLPVTGELLEWREAAERYISKNNLNPALVNNPRGLMSELCCCDLDANGRIDALETNAVELLKALKEVENLTRWFTKDRVEIPVLEWRAAIEHVEAAIRRAEAANAQV